MQGQQRSFYKDIGREDLAVQQGLVDDETASKPVTYKGRLSALEKQVAALTQAVAALTPNATQPAARLHPVSTGRLRGQ